MNFIIPLLAVTLCVWGSEGNEYKKVELSLAEYGVSLVDNSDLRPDVNVKSLCLKKGDWVVNGGYYSEKFKSLGYLKITGREINPKINSGLSGFFGIKSDGSVELFWTKNLKSEIYSEILQNGPFLIDPGGKMGINSDDGKSANRVAIGMKENGRLVLIYAEKITLHKLASLVHSEDSKNCFIAEYGWGSNGGFLVI